ncbi:MAG TPA: ergothioneine biosynthesis glutamate--cysteine ligase EgtA [Micromonosporaceae bacterium]|nr:ergothioneine biosynthesis glutamate--cysteine ligase EgtA [Micromonosporaceae bacterium]
MVGFGVDEAVAHIVEQCLVPGEPGTVGVELEWLVEDRADPAAAVDPARLRRLRAASGRVTVEPGGQLELSSAPAPSLGACVAETGSALRQLRADLAADGLAIVGSGTEPRRPARRRVDEPRYVAMEEYFDRTGPAGRAMMCGTASVQVNLDAGRAGDVARRWRLAHAIGPVLVAAFANSAWFQGRPTGYKSTRQAGWQGLDAARTAAPVGDDPRLAWARYALDAPVLCVRGAQAPWLVPERLTFRHWLSGGGPRPARADDLDYHLTTLFPPVRPRRWLELRMIDAQPNDGWIVPLAVTTALIEDARAADLAFAATECLGGDAWSRAARLGPDDAELRRVSLRCFEAALAALPRLGAPTEVRQAVDHFADRYLSVGRCPADDQLASSGRHRNDEHAAADPVLQEVNP